MHIEFQVEEASMEVALENIAPKIIKGRATFRIINYRSKSGLLKNIPSRLRGYHSRFRNPNENMRIIIIIDEDRSSCHELKTRLEDHAKKSGLYTKTSPDSNGFYSVVNRIVVEELEAWFFGDNEALKKSYPRLPKNLHLKSRYRNPDSIKGGTWEALNRELKKAGYYKSYFPKMEVAKKISSAMCPSRNRSKSFQVFHLGLESLFI